MKKFIIFIVFLFCIGVINNRNINDICNDNSIDEIVENKYLVQDNDEITMRDIADFLITKKEHYPLSDEFMERYQQTSGGYIDNAKKTNIVVNKKLHEPNQKWHFFESWLYPSIEDTSNSLTWDSLAKQRVYTNLLCPELLLWIYEACDVDISKVRSAKIVAEQGKINSTSTNTIAKNMRNCVSWEDCEKAILMFKNENSEPFNVTVEKEEGVVIEGLESSYTYGSNVSFSVNVISDNKLIGEVKMNEEVLTSDNGVYSFIMPYENVKISISLVDKKEATNVVLTSNNIEMKIGEKNKVISASVEPIDTTDKPIWTIEKGNDIISISSNDKEVRINALKEGSAVIRVTYNELIYSECNVVVDKNDDIIGTEISSSYDIVYDLGSYVQSRLLANKESVFNVFSLKDNNSSIIDSIYDFGYLYGGGYSSGNWYKGDMLKFGTQSVNGFLALSLSSYVNQVKITGYTSNSTSKIRIGDNFSLDRDSTTGDNKTTLVTLSEMTVASKETVYNNQVSEIVIDFEETNNLRSATTNKKPLYITSIEFRYIKK